MESEADLGAEKISEPAVSTRRRFDVVTTFNVVWTSRQRRNNVVCLLQVLKFSNQRIVQTVVVVAIKFHFHETTGNLKHVLKTKKAVIALKVKEDTETSDVPKEHNAKAIKLFNLRGNKNDW